MVEGKKSENTSVAEKLVEYGYAYKRANEYIPNVVVISQSTNQKFLKFCERKSFSAAFIEHADARGKLHNSILNTIEKINCAVREILYADLPECVRTNAKMVDALLESICTTSHTLGYVVHYALASGWLNYDENTSPAIGAYFHMP